MYCCIHHNQKQVCIIAVTQSFSINKKIKPYTFNLDDTLTGHLCYYFEEHCKDENRLQIICHHFPKLYREVLNELAVPYELLFNDSVIDLYTLTHFISRRSKIISVYERIRPAKTLSLLFKSVAVKERPCGIVKETAVIAESYNYFLKARIV